MARGTEAFKPIDPEQMAEDEIALTPTTAPSSVEPSTQPAIVATPATQPTKVTEIPTEEITSPSKSDDEKE